MAKTPTEHTNTYLREKSRWLLENMGLAKYLVTCIHFSLIFLRLQQMELSACSQAKNLCNNLCRFVQIKIKITDYIRF